MNGLIPCVCIAFTVGLFVGAAGWTVYRTKALRAENAYRGEHALRIAAEDRECDARKSMAQWREAYTKLANEYHNAMEALDIAKATLHGTEESLKFAREGFEGEYERAEKIRKVALEACAVASSINDEKCRLRRLFERMRFHNPHRLGKHKCCPCVKDMQQEYVDAAIGKDA